MKKLTLTLCVVLYTTLVVAQNVKTVGKSNLKEENGQWFKIESKDVSYKVDEKILTIKLKNKSALNQLTEKYRLKIVRNSISGFVDVQVPENTKFIDIAEKLSGDPEIEVLDINTFGNYPAAPNDPHYSSQWYLPRIGMPAVWELFKGPFCGEIAVIDSGIDIAHQDLGLGSDAYHNLWSNPGEDAWTDPNDPTTGNGVDDDGNGLIDDWRGWDFNAGNNDVRSPGNNHGTHVSGVLAAKGNNSVGIAGVGGGFGLSGFKIMFLGVGDTDPSSAALDDAIIYAVQKGAKVIQISLSVGSTSAIDAAILSAVSAGIPVICASGNSFGAITYPATNTNVMAVGATTNTDARAGFSNWGPGLFIAAPGVGIRSTQNANDYGDLDGTSFAAPQVSAVVGLMKAIKPSLTIAQIRTILQNTASKVGGYNYSWNASLPGHSQELGYGLLDAYKAIQHVLGGPINGPDLFCTTGSYSLSGTPPGAVTWSGTSGNFFSVNSSTGVATRYPEGNGPGYVEASIASGCGSVILKKLVYSGVPYYDHLDVEAGWLGSGQGKVLSSWGNTQMEAGYTLFMGSEVASILEYGFEMQNHSNWFVTPLTLTSIEMNYWSLPNPTSQTIHIRARNSCGWGDYKATNWTVSTLFAKYTVSPNPASDRLTLLFEDLIDPKGIPNDLELFHESSTISVRTKKVSTSDFESIKNNNNRLSMEVKDLPRGIYYLHVNYNEKKNPDRHRILLE